MTFTFQNFVGGIHHEQLNFRPWGLFGIFGMIDCSIGNIVGSLTWLGLLILMGNPFMELLLVQKLLVVLVAQDLEVAAVEVRCLGWQW